MAPRRAASRIRRLSALVRVCLLFVVAIIQYVVISRRVKVCFLPQVIILYTEQERVNI